MASVVIQGETAANDPTYRDPGLRGTIASLSQDPISTARAARQVEQRRVNLALARAASGVVIPFDLTPEVNAARDEADKAIEELRAARRRHRAARQHVAAIEGELATAVGRGAGEPELQALHVRLREAKAAVAPVRDLVDARAVLARRAVWRVLRLERDLAAAYDAQYVTKRAEAAEAVRLARVALDKALDHQAVIRSCGDRPSRDLHGFEPQERFNELEAEVTELCGRRPEQDEVNEFAREAGL